MTCINKHLRWIATLGLIIASILIFLTSAVAQFRRDRSLQGVNVSSYPQPIQKDYKVFENKCSECHSLSSSLEQSRSEQGWATEVKRMQAMASSHINTDEASQIIEFLVYDDIHRKAADREKARANLSSAPAEAGQQLFDKFGCSSCHSVAGRGGEIALDGIGNKRDATELKKFIVSPPSGSSMPSTSAPDQEINDLVTYLLTLRSR